MITTDQLRTLTGLDVHDRDGDRIGTVGRIRQDDAGRPAWAGVRTGLFGRTESLVPLEGAHLDDDRLVVPFARAVVKEAPAVDTPPDEPLTPHDVRRLCDHYGLLWFGAENVRILRPRLPGRRSIG
ncbi:PRC-barrel domain-containing protein [Actinoplanes sp. CA-252034]|uniref:PRC-barrel domain-containing protein n=1 Tax=Actinoplanes sp. CA-252034 TaxID=3239906 RepID=UPI003D95888A